MNYPPIIIDLLKKIAGKSIESLKIFDRCYNYFYLNKFSSLLRDNDSNEIRYLKAFHYHSFDNIVVSDITVDFRIDIPNEYSEELKRSNFYTNHEEGCSNKIDYMKKLINFIESNYPQLNESPQVIIDRFVNYTSEYFLNELNNGNAKSNNTILGVDSFKMRNGNNAEMELFTTDYFTYNCLVRLYKYLLEINKTPFQITSIEDIERVSPFLCSCGIGGFINLKYKGALLGRNVLGRNPLKTIKGTLITKRSSVAACPNHWHASFDETFDIRDKVSAIQGERPSLGACLSRGLNEELGIHIDSVKHNLKNMVLFCISNSNRLEAEFFVSIDILINSDDDLRAFVDSYQCASDAENENSHLILVPSYKIYDFFKSKRENGEYVTPEALELSRLYSALDRNVLLSTLKLIK